MKMFQDLSIRNDKLNGTIENTSTMADDDNSHQEIAALTACRRGTICYSRCGSSMLSDSNSESLESPRLLQNSCRRSQKVEAAQLNSDYELMGKESNSDSARSSGQPKFEMDFNQGSASAADTVSGTQADVAVDLAPNSTDETTRDGNDSEMALTMGVDTPDEKISTESDDNESEEVKAELEGESRRLPEAPVQRVRIQSQPILTKTTRQDLVFGKMSIMVSEVSEDALLVPLRSSALSDLLENQHTYRAIAGRCGCELVFTRRVVVKRLVKWTRYVVLLLRGPSDAALKRFRAKLEAANSAFHQAVPYDNEKPRPRLLTSEHLPDNLELAVCAERTGRATSGWERLPVDMPQRRQGKPLYGKAKNTIMPNNISIGPVLSYVYPKWGFQSTKPIPQTLAFKSAVDKALEMEKEQEEEFRKESIKSILSNR